MLLAQLTRAFIPLALLGFAVWLSRSVQRIVGRFLLRKFTAVGDLDRVGRPRMSGPIHGTAVVCGGSFSGLFTARVCASHFEKVIVVEPEAFTFTDEAVNGEPLATRHVDDHTNGPYQTIAHKRTRVYQYLSVHLYQVILTRFLRAVFPTFDASAKQVGARFTANDAFIHIGGRRVLFPHKSVETSADYANQGMFIARRTLETLVRRLVIATCANVSFINGTVTDFVLKEDSSAVSSVVVRTADGSSTELPCELVADCTGNTQAGYKILKRVVPGLSLQRDEYNPKFYLVSMEFPSPPNFDEDLAKLGIPGISTLEEAKAAPFFHLGGPDAELDYKHVVAGRVDGRIVIAAGGYDSELPTTLDGVREYASGVLGSAGVTNPVPDYYYAILDLLEPVAEKGTVFLGRCIACSRIYYEAAADKLPHNYVAVGDSSLRLNPRAGEGVTKVSVGALTLDGVLRDSHPADKDFGATFFKRMESRTGHLWLASKLSDYGMPTTIPVKGESLDSGKFVFNAINRLNAVMCRDDSKFWRGDAATAKAFWGTMQFMRPPTDLFTPGTLGRLACEFAWAAWNSNDSGKQ
ncbi:hypothetical protein BKA62DRAFT_618789 [Auriculariales sp. MPI-PUGE-AT-0066]|nr:hypothetical protein BKA62DRAFT_618789 [Auriculariales sp. MPI-PUGE-AT-0066]